MIAPLPPASAAGDEADKRYLGAEGAQELFDWINAVISSPDLSSIREADLKSSPGRAEITFTLADGSPSPTCRFELAKPLAESAEALVLSDSRIVCSGWPDRLQTRLVERFRSHPPPLIWTIRPSPETLPPGHVAPEAWRWFLLPFVFLPLFLLVPLLIAWRRDDAGPGPDPVLRLVVIGATLIVLTLDFGAFNGLRVYDVDSERDLTAALLFARGIEAPLYGPSIHSSALYLGPLYQSLLGITALFSELPEALFALSLLAQLLTLPIGAAFMRRSFGRVAACVFALTWAGSYLPVANLTRITHNYLAFPFVALALWVLWDTLRRRDARHLPLVVLLLGVATQLYAVYALGFLSLVIVLAVSRIYPDRRQLLACAGMLLLTQIFTIGFFLAELMSGAGIAVPSGDTAASRTGFMKAITCVWDSFAGVHPFGGLFFSSIVLACLVMFLWRSLGGGHETPKDTALARKILLAYLLPPIAIVLLLFWDQFRSTYTSSFLLFSLFAVSAGAGDLAGFTKWRPGRGFSCAVAGGFLIAMAAGILIASPMTPDENHKILYQQHSIDLIDQRAVASALKRAGIKTPGLLRTRVHGWIVHGESTTMRLGSLLMLTDDPPGESELEDREVWLTRETLPPLDPAASVRIPAARFLPFKVVAYRSQLDLRRQRISVGPEAPGDVFTDGLGLPLRPFYGTRTTMLFYDGSEKTETNALISETAELGGSIRIEIPLRSPLTRPLTGIVSPACRVRIFADGREIRPEFTADDILPRRFTIPPVGDKRAVVVEIDTIDCKLEHFDLFDLPIAKREGRFEQ